ncbi:RNA-binding protein Musashi-like protein Rbp6 [Frankliniella fusca]|uniref:RNA-binding protein Musashi-like protein Rbp6 n=1 Tax=Frankliniella fusca TaxID=407009 RepID=A0AAE1HE01_9NEOP|nr:RNA-binding protein Musashi-like protein Rbp6 [Frankliniella fusca]
MPPCGLVMNNYQAAAAAAAQGFGPPTSPHSSRGAFPAASSPGPGPMDLYSSSDYVQAASPQPQGAFPAMAVSRAPGINYSPVWRNRRWRLLVYGGGKPVATGATKAAPQKFLRELMLAR